MLQKRGIWSKIDTLSKLLAMIKRSRKFLKASQFTKVVELMLPFMKNFFQKRKAKKLKMMMLIFQEIFQIQNPSQEVWLLNFNSSLLNQIFELNKMILIELKFLFLKTLFFIWSAISFIFASLNFSLLLIEMMLN